MSDLSVAFVGPQGAGKTSLIQRLCCGGMLDSRPTIGLFVYTDPALPGVRIWDTPGNDSFSWAAEGPMRRAGVIVYCSTEPHTRDYSAHNADARIVRVRTKADIAAPFAADLSTSALTGEGIEELRRIIREVQAGVTAEPLPAPIPLSATEAPKKACC